MRRLFFGTLSVLLALSAPVHARSDNCAPREVVAERLQERYREAPLARGLTPNGSIVEMWASARGETWSVIVVLPSGQSCLVASGSDFEALAAPAEAGDPA